jgi:hypothetical protein
MPGVLVPAVAARMELISIAGVVGVVDDKSELTAEVVLMASTYIPGRRHRVHAYPLDPVQETGELRVGGKPTEDALKIRLIEDEARVASRDATLVLRRLLR